MRAANVSRASVLVWRAGRRPTFWWNFAPPRCDRSKIKTSRALSPIRLSLGRGRRGGMCVETCGVYAASFTTLELLILCRTISQQLSPEPFFELLDIPEEQCLTEPEHGFTGTWCDCGRRRCQIRPSRVNPSTSVHGSIVDQTLSVLLLPNTKSGFHISPATRLLTNMARTHH